MIVVGFVFIAQKLQNGVEKTIQKETSFQK
jgi:hypothetical protein